MSWTHTPDLKAQVQRLWDRGELLRPLVSGETFEPLRLTLKAPSSTDLTDRFDAVRAWIADLLAAPAVRIEWREVQHRVLGAQRLPHSVWLDALEPAWRWIGRRGDAQRFADTLALTRQTQPALQEWLARRPLQAIELAPDWPRLMSVVSWLQAHPRPGVHLRQVDQPGVHSKFIEAHRGVLSELLDRILPREAIDTDHTGVAGFAARYGFAQAPALIRFRILDPALNWPPGLCIRDAPAPDVTLDADSFARLTLPVNQVFITENKTNFLTFPAVPRALVVFGAGYGWEALGQAQWLHRCRLHHWGDIDTHGFAILDGLRARFPHASSLLMDHETLLAHVDAWGEEPEPVSIDLPRLNPAEAALYDDLRTHRIRRHVRLEQERIGYSWLQDRLPRLSRSE